MEYLLKQRDTSNYARRARKLRGDDTPARTNVLGVYAFAALAALMGCAAADDGASAGTTSLAYVPPADAASCEPGDPKRERYGTNCLCCHTGDFTVAGSIDLLGGPVARVVVTDSAGNRAEMAPDPYGNFFRHAPLIPPLTAVAFGPDGRARAMQMPAPHAACNECHRPDGVAPRIAGP
jgi:hypothetical protein